jgi:endonuclease/exonuclease/phosphatase family metal-dependent hydrolase
MCVYKIATININAITNYTRLKILEEFTYYHDVDIVFLQEVACLQLRILHNYTHHINTGTDGRGTAILAKQDVHLIYTDLIIAGDFNCILNNTDATGQNSYSKALAQIVRGLDLTDAWCTNTARTTYTHYAPTGASRIDRFYISNSMQNKKKHIETVAAAFTDHLAVILHMSTNVPRLYYGRSQWKMNVSLLNNGTFLSKLQTLWSKWRLKKNTTTTTLCGGRDVSKKRYAKHSSEKARKGRETERNWKIFTTQPYTKH